MNTADEPAGNPADTFEARLAAHLQSEEPSSVVIVGQPPGAQWWLSGAGPDDLRVLSFGSLAQCLAELPLPVDANSTNGLAADLPAESGSESNNGTGKGAGKEAGEVPRGSCVALMQLNHPDSLPEEGSLAAELGQAVRRFPERLVVSIESEEPEDAAFFAFGFRKLQMGQQESIRLFEYCLSEYKQSPDWLNARYWANPERFSLDDDPDYDSDYDPEDSDDDEE